MIPSRFFPDVVPVNVRRASSPSLGAISSVLLAIASVAMPSQASGGGAWCTAPYVQVAGPGVGVEQTGELQIQSISIGEPFASCSARSLTVVIKVNTLDPGNTGQVTPPYNTQWEAEFLVPHNLLSPDPGIDQLIFVSWDTKVLPTGQFNYGFLDNSSITPGPVQSGSRYTSQCSPGLGTCAATGTVTPDGTITISLDMTTPLSFKDITGNLRFTMPALPVGWQLTRIAGNTWTCACVAGSGVPVNVSNTTGFQNYTIQGNLSCSNPPVVADPPIAALTGSPMSGSAPLTVNFDASGSTNAPGGCGTINSYFFDFGDGKKATQSTATVSHTYSSGGSYPARVKVTNLAGLTSTNNAEVDIAVGSATPPAQRVREDVYVANGPVYAMVALGNTVYFGGAFTQVGPATGSAVPIDSTSGLPVTGFPKVVGSVSAVAADGSGGWFIGGNFTSVGGVSRLNIAHVMADNTVSAWNPNADGTVNALAVSGSVVYAGGAFTNIGGQTRNHIAALDANTGLATAWDPNADGTINALAVSGSVVYAGGDFVSIGGQSRSRIAALDSTTGLASAWNPNANNTVFALAVNGSTIYAGGDFTNIGGQLRNRIAALDASNGQASLLWNPNASNTVFALAVSNSTVYAGGSFFTIGGQPRNNIAALDAATGLANLLWNPNANGYVHVLAVNGLTVYAGGQFTNIGGQLRSYIAALGTTGAATSWNPKMNNTVNALAASGGVVYAAGSFTSVGAQDRNNLAALDATTGLATSWNPSANTTVFAMAADSSTVYAGGAFTNVGGQPRKHIAALGATNGSATAWDANVNDLGLVWALAVKGSTVYAGGWFTNIGGQPRNRIAALDTSSALATPWDPNANDTVLALTVSGSTVYAGGAFTNIGGQPRNRIAALDATSGLATTWDPNANNEISALAVSGPTVYAAGVFSSIGGQTRKNIAALDATSGLATAWNADTNYRVLSLALSGPTLYAGGYFTTIGGQARNRIAALDAATGSVAPWDPNADAGFLFPSISALAVSDGRVYAGGNFTSAGGLPQSYIAGIEALTPVQLVSAVSRKAHGNAGTFDVNLPLTGSPGIECRSGGANGDYTLLFKFTNPLSNVGGASVTTGTGSVSTSNIDGNDAHNYVVNLTGVTNAQTITVSLTNMTDSVGNFSGAVSASMGVLIGDVNASGVVTSGDTNLCKAQALQPVTSANFRNDVNASGNITTGDVNIIKQNALSQLPP